MRHCHVDSVTKVTYVAWKIQKNTLEIWYYKKIIGRFPPVLRNIISVKYKLMLYIISIGIFSVNYYWISTKANSHMWIWAWDVLVDFYNKYNTAERLVFYSSMRVFYTCTYPGYRVNTEDISSHGLTWERVVFQITSLLLESLKGTEANERSGSCPKIILVEPYRTSGRENQRRKRLCQLNRFIQLAFHELYMVALRDGDKYICRGFHIR